MSSGGGSAKGRGTRWSPAPSSGLARSRASLTQYYEQVPSSRPPSAEYWKPVTALSPFGFVTVTHHSVSSTITDVPSTTLVLWLPMSVVVVPSEIVYLPAPSSAT